MDKLTYDIAVDHEPENPNPHPWTLQGYRFEDPELLRIDFLAEYEEYEEEPSFLIVTNP